MNIHVVVGTRPQYIKWAALEDAFRNTFNVTVIDTGQHYDSRLSTVFFEDFRLRPADLNLGMGSGRHAKQTGTMMVKLEDFWYDKHIDLVVVLGDTNSTLAGALAAAKLRIPIGHVEAGIRSFNKTMPEEINRVLTDHVSTLLWCPTKTAVRNLRREAIVRGVIQTGDVMYELFLRMKHRIASEEQVLHDLHLKNKDYGVMTIHRQENTKDKKRLAPVFRAVSRLRYPIVFPVHPRTQVIIRSMSTVLPKNLILLGPEGYIRFLSLVQHATVVITDSGGLMRECAWLGVPCVVLRDETEWPELVERGWNLLVSPNEGEILRALMHKKKTRPLGRIFGDSHTGQRLVTSIQSWWKKHNAIDT